VFWTQNWWSLRVSSPSGKPGFFRIEEVFLGELHGGDSIDLGDFKLSVTQQYGPPKIEPINRATRILFFLQGEELCNAVETYIF
jgi:hypothetical protein